MAGITLIHKNCEMLNLGGVKFYGEKKDSYFMFFLLKVINLSTMIKDLENPLFKDSWTDVGFAGNYIPKKVADVLETELMPGLAYYNDIPTVYQVREGKVWLFDLTQMNSRFDSVFGMLDVIKLQLK